MSRALDLKLAPSDTSNKGAELEIYTYAPAANIHRSMAEAVYLGLDAGRCRFSVELTPDEARVLANQLLQVADAADEHRAAHEADDELQASFDQISEDMRDAEERGSTVGCYYAHPDVHYVPADQVESKVRELSAAGVKRFMVLVDPTEARAA